MPNMKNVNSKAGYDQEEAYFFERNRELIEKKKATKPELVVLQGGKANNLAPASPPGRQSEKKAA